MPQENAWSEGSIMDHFEEYLQPTISIGRNGTKDPCHTGSLACIYEADVANA